MTLSLNSLGSFSNFPDFSDEINNRLQNHVEAVSSIIKDAHRARDDVQSDPGLNSRGKSERIRKVFDHARVAVDKANAHHGASFVKMVENTKSAIPTRVSRQNFAIGGEGDSFFGEKIIRNSLERLHHQQQEQEIRQHLLTMEPTVRVAAVQGAAADGDTHTILAAKNAPHIMHLIDPNVLAEAEQTCIRAMHPDKFEALAQAEAALEAFNVNAEAAIRMLGGDDADPVRAAAQSTID